MSFKEAEQTFQREGRSQVKGLHEKAMDSMVEYWQHLLAADGIREKDSYISREGEYLFMAANSPDKKSRFIVSSASSAVGI